MVVEVLIRVRAGMKTNRCLKGLESLNNQVRSVNIDLSWVEAFNQCYGVELDPNKYFIGRRRTQTKGQYQTPTHSLVEKVSVLLGEFRMEKKEFVVYLVRNNGHVFDAPEGFLTPTALKMMTQKMAMIKQYNGSPFGNMGRGIDVDMPPSSRTQKWISKRNRNENVPSLSPKRGRYVEDTFANDEENAQSTMSFESQDSELDGLGIDYQDLKTPLRKRIKLIPNSALLRSRQELQMFKKRKPERFYKLLAIFPTFFDILIEFLNA